MTSRSLIFLLLSLLGTSAKETPPALAKMDQLRYDVMLAIDTLWTNHFITNDIDNNGQDEKLMDRFREMSENLTAFKIESLGPLEWELEYAQFIEDIKIIDKFFEAFQSIQQKPVRWRHESAWTNMALFILERSDKGLNGTLTKLESYNYLFKKGLEDSKASICELQQSQQQMIYNLYNMIALAELKGYTMLQFAWMLLKIYEKGNFKTEADLMRNLYTERSIQKMNAAKEAMSDASRSVYRCDARSWIEGETFIRLTKLLQGYIENEVNLNSEGTCGQNCAYYSATRYYGCFKQQFCSMQPPCRGEILRCTYYDSDMNICQSSSNDRRYEWIEYENRMVLGRKNSCPARNLHKVDSWWRYLFWHCSYCFCVCDDNQPSSDRFFSLRDVSSNVSDNKVITGVRFVKDNQVIHVQIQEAPLLPGGLVNKTESQWVPIKSFKPMDEDVANGIDYFTMNHTHRAVDLDDAVAPISHVLTAVRLRTLGPHINLEIGATPYDFATGQLDQATKTVWISNDNTEGVPKSPREEVILTDPDVPTLKGPHTTYSRHDQLIKFRESSLKGDVSQSTVPYLDSQPLESMGQVLAGLGLHHKGSLNSGGFIALKLITYDFSSHMSPQTPVA